MRDSLPKPAVGGGGGEGKRTGRILVLVIPQAKRTTMMRIKK